MAGVEAADGSKCGAGMTWRRGIASGPAGPSSEASQQWASMRARICSATARASRPASPLTRGSRAVRIDVDEIVQLQRQGVDGVEARAAPAAGALRQSAGDNARPARASARRRGTAAAGAFRWAGPAWWCGRRSRCRRTPAADQTCIRRDLLVADARGRERGHAAALELQPGVGHVLVAAQDGNPQGLDLPHAGCGPATAPGRCRGSSGPAPRPRRSSGR